MLVYDRGKEYTLPALKKIIDFTLASYGRKYPILSRRER